MLKNILRSTFVFYVIKKKKKKKTESVSKKEVRKNEKMHEKSPECHSFK